MRQEPGDFDPRESMHPNGGCLPPMLVLVVLAAIAVGALVCAIETAYGEEGEADATFGFTRPAAVSYSTAPHYSWRPSLSPVARTASASGTFQGPSRPSAASPTLVAESPTPVQPKRECGARDAMLNFARRVFHETPVGSFPAQDGSAYILTMSTEKAGWTLLQCTAERCCVVGSGQGAIFLKGA